MKIIVPLDISSDDAVLEAWKQWDKGRVIFKYSTEDGHGSGVASKFETEGIGDLEVIDSFVKKLEDDFTKFYTGFKFGLRQKT